MPVLNDGFFEKYFCSQGYSQEVVGGFPRRHERKYFGFY